MIRYSSYGATNLRRTSAQTYLDPLEVQYRELLELRERVRKAEAAAAGAESDACSIIAKIRHSWAEHHPERLHRPGSRPSVPQEITATVDLYEIPFVPIGETRRLVRCSKAFLVKERVLKLVRFTDQDHFNY